MSPPQPEFVDSTERGLEYRNSHGLDLKLGSRLTRTESFRTGLREET